MSKKAKAVDFHSCVSQVKFAPSDNLISVSKTHYSADGSVLSDCLVEIPLTTNTFDTAMQIASAIVSNVGLVSYEEQ